MRDTIYATTYPDDYSGPRVRIKISGEDAQRWLDATREAPGAAVFGPWVRVHNFSEGREVDLRAAPCGADCRCAAQIRGV